MKSRMKFKKIKNVQCSSLVKEKVRKMFYCSFCFSIFKSLFYWLFFRCINLWTCLNISILEKITSCTCYADKIWILSFEDHIAPKILLYYISIGWKEAQFLLELWKSFKRLTKKLCTCNKKMRHNYVKNSKKIY